MMSPPKTSASASYAFAAPRNLRNVGSDPWMSAAKNSRVGRVRAERRNSPTAPTS